MLMCQAMHKQNLTNAQVSKAHEVQQGQCEEQYMQMQLIVEYELHWATLTLQGAHPLRTCPRPPMGWPTPQVSRQTLLNNVYKYD